LLDKVKTTLAPKLQADMVRHHVESFCAYGHSFI
jgi:hypothetical protein